MSTCTSLLYYAYEHFTVVLFQRTFPPLYRAYRPFTLSIVWFLEAWYLLLLIGRSPNANLCSIPGVHVDISSCKIVQLTSPKFYGVSSLHPVFWMPVICSLNNFNLVCHYLTTWCIVLTLSLRHCVQYNIVMPFYFNTGNLLRTVLCSFLPVFQQTAPDCHPDGSILAPGSLTVWKLESSLMWNCGETSPVLRLSTREMSLACCSDWPRYTPTHKHNFLLWWMVVFIWWSCTNAYTGHPNECQCLGLLATLVPRKDLMGVCAY